jgi:hypothetical protein
VRWQRGLPSQKAYVYLPDDPRLRVHAFQIAEARRHVLRPPTDRDDEITEAGLTAEAQRELAELLPEQLSLFSVLSATATGMSVHGITEDGLTQDAAVMFDDEPEVPEPTAAADNGLVELAEVPTEAGWVLSGTRSVGEIKAQLRDRNAELALRLVDRTGWSHGKVHRELNQLSGITAVGSATNDQLERRARHAEQWLARLRR